MIAIDMNMPRGCDGCLFLFQGRTDDLSIRKLNGPEFYYRCSIEWRLDITDNDKPLQTRHKNCPLIEIKKENKNEM